MILITSNSDLKILFRNVFAEVPGEPTFYEKLLPHLEKAEDWLSSNLVDPSLFVEVPGEDFNHWAQAKKNAIIVVGAMALHEAAPQLDLALTANGFVTAGTPTAVPISSQRMERFLTSLEIEIDSAIQNLLYELKRIKAWSESEQFRFFAESIFQDLRLCRQIISNSPNYRTREQLGYGHFPAPEFSYFLSLRAEAICFEGVLADSYISRELMETLRLRLISNSLRPEDERVVSDIRGQVIRMLNGGRVNDQLMRSLVEYIRRKETAFPEWHASETSKLFNSTFFNNEKDSSGYFFS